MRRRIIGLATQFPFLFAMVTRLISLVIQRLLNLKIYKLQKHSNMFGIEATNGLQKLIYSLLDGLRNCFILRQTVCGIILFLDRLFAKSYFIDKCFAEIILFFNKKSFAKILMCGPSFF